MTSCDQQKILDTNFGSQVVILPQPFSQGKFWTIMLLMVI